MHDTSDTATGAWLAPAKRRLVDFYESVPLRWKSPINHETRRLLARHRHATRAEVVRHRDILDSWDCRPYASNCPGEGCHIHIGEACEHRSMLHQLRLAVGE